MTDMQYQYQEAYPGLFGKFLTLVNLGISKTLEQGATSALFAAMSPDIEKNDWNGVYIDDWVCIMLTLSMVHLEHIAICANGV